MLSTILSMSLMGMEGYLVNVEVDIRAGMPTWEIVGLPDASVRESRERVITAIKNSGFELTSRKIVINLAPASTKKEGPSFDLPIAVGILTNLHFITQTEISEFLFLGELSLDGKINKVSGILPMCIEAKKLNIKKVVIPYANRMEAGIVKGLDIYPVQNLQELVSFLNGIKIIKPFECIAKYKNSFLWNEGLDFSDVKGQAKAKRALEIAAAGGHNCLLIGPPGAGKTMLAKRLPTILPQLSFEEALEVTKIYSIAGKLNENEGMIVTRPFRAPHHSASSTSLTGGGSKPKPGEMSLAHYGVLFLDELPEFRRDVLETMRIPLEDGKISLARASGTYMYPCNFMLVASMNPCPCGYAGDKKNHCTCSEKQKENYLKKLSGPLLDRIDIQVEVLNVTYQELSSRIKMETSETIRKRVNDARNIQANRYQKLPIFSNAELSSTMLGDICVLENNAKKLLEQAFQRFHFSARGYEKTIKVARTIADLEASESILEEHIAEAIQYRILDRKIFQERNE